MDENEWRKDCSYGDWNNFYCPLAIDKETGITAGFPFEVGCPDKEPWEKWPTCFEDTFNASGHYI